MPQAKFQVFGKFTDAEGNYRRPGDILTLEAGEDGKPVDVLASSRVRPYRGEVVGDSTDVPQDVKDSVDAYIAEVEEKANALLDEAGQKAAQIVSDAEAKAGVILDEAGQKAAQIVSDAEASKTKK